MHTFRTSKSTPHQHDIFPYGCYGSYHHSFTISCKSSLFVYINAKEVLIFCSVMRFLNFFSIFVAKYMDMSEQEIEQQNTVTDDNRMILRTENLVKKYGKRTVVSHVSFDVKQGEIVGLLGPNGAGKTTSFYMTTGLIVPNEGHIFLNDLDITSYPVYKRAQNGIGYLAQEASVFVR